jgi:hypothetical protein
MPGFRRAQLRGSEELFRTTADENGDGDQAPMEEAGPSIHPVPAAPTPDVRSVRLTEEEIGTLIEAVQSLKFPGKTASRPSIGAFEELEELRQKLLHSL